MASAISSGLPSGGSTRSSGTGVTHRFSASIGPISPSAEWAGPMSIGRARRFRPRSMSRQTLVAIRYSQDGSAERPSNVSMFFQARTMVSWAASSASKADPSMR